MLSGYGEEKVYDGPLDYNLLFCKGKLSENGLQNYIFPRKILQFAFVSTDSTSANISKALSPHFFVV